MCCEVNTLRSFTNIKAHDCKPCTSDDVVYVLVVDHLFYVCSCHSFIKLLLL